MKKTILVIAAIFLMIVLLMIKWGPPEIEEVWAQARSSAGIDSLRVNEYLVITNAAGDTVAAFNASGLHIYDSPISIPAGAFFVGDSNSTELGALRDTLVVDNIPYTETLRFGQGSTTYRLASYDMLMPPSFSVIDSIVLYVYVDETDQDSCQFSLTKNEIGLGETVDIGFTDAQTGGLRISAAANDLERIVFPTPYTGSVEAGDWWFIRLIRTDPAADPETDDVYLVFVEIYYH